VLPDSFNSVAIIDWFGLHCISHSSLWRNYPSKKPSLRKRSQI